MYQHLERVYQKTKMAAHIVPQYLVYMRMCLNSKMYEGWQWWELGFKKRIPLDTMWAYVSFMVESSFNCIVSLLTESEHIYFETLQDNNMGSTPSSFSLQNMD